MFLSGREPSKRAAAATHWPLIAIALVLASPVQAAYREGFETPEATWQLSETDCGAQLVAHERTFLPTNVHAGAGAEFLRIRSGQGSYVFIAHPVGRARIIHELRPSLWIKANRAGLQLRGRVVLPRSRDPLHGEPTTLWVEGEVYDQPGAWKQLAIRDIVLQVQRRARIKRAPQNSPEIDEREAYLDMLVINAYGGPGVTDLWIDDLEIAGYTEAGAGPQPAEHPADHAATWQALEDAPYDHPHLAAPAGEEHPPHMEGATLVAGRGPLAVRMIESCGESLSRLKALGFNAVRLPHPPSPLLVDEARRLNLWLVAPPPQSTGQAEIHTGHDRVLAWDLGSDLAARDVERTRRLAQAVRRDDPHRNRPLLVAPRESLWNYRRMADVMLFGEEPLGTGVSIEDYRSRLAAQGGAGPRSTPFWASIQTEPRREIVEQLDSLAGAGFAAMVEAEQIRLLALAALEAGATGLCFRSRTPLDGGDPASQHRAAVLHALNRELSLIEPWIAGPSRLDTLDVGVEGVRVTVWETDRSKLLLVAQHNADEQFAAAPCPARVVSLLLSGAPASWKAYRLGADRLIPLWSSQVGGGMRLAAPDVGRLAVLVVTDDALTINFLLRRQRQHLGPAAKLRHEILTRELAVAEEALNQAPPDLPFRSEIIQRREEARAALRQCQALLDASDAAGSLTMAERGEQSLANLRRLVWSGAADAFPARTTSPLCVSFAALPLHWSLTQRLPSASWGPNALAGGDFENVPHLRAMGWTQERAADGAFRAEVELSPDRPRQGQYSFHLHATRLAASLPESAAGSAPLVRLVSAGVPVEHGAVVRIRGWVRVTDVEPGASRPLRVFDTIGGPATGVELGASEDWRSFTLYRVAPVREPLKVAFELRAPGKVWIDAVSVEVLAGLPPPTPPQNQARHNPFLRLPR